MTVLGGGEAEKIIEIRDQNSDISNSYIIRPRLGKDLFEFTAEADDNYFQPSHVQHSLSQNLLDDQSIETVWPGERHMTILLTKFLQKACGGQVSAIPMEINGVKKLRSWPQSL